MQSRAQLLAELKAIRAARTADGWVVVVQSAIKWGALVIIFRYGYLAMVALAGKTTLADIGINFLGKAQVSNVIAWLFGGGGAVYGVSQRNLRHSTTETLQNRIKALEAREDPKRSSSHLTPRGESRPEDKI